MVSTELVLLRWQEFATRLVSVFFDTPPRCRWRILVCVKARVVNWKQVDVTALRSFWLPWDALIDHCTRQWGALSETVATVSLSTVQRLFLLSRRTCGGGQAVSRTDLPCVHAGLKLCCGSEGSFQETAPRMTAKNTVKHRDGGVGLMVANHRGGSESLVVVTALI